MKPPSHLLRGTALPIISNAFSYEEAYEARERGREFASGCGLALAEIAESSPANRHLLLQRIVPLFQGLIKDIGREATDLHRAGRKTAFCAVFLVAARVTLERFFRAWLEVQIGEAKADVDGWKARLELRD